MNNQKCTSRVFRLILLNVNKFSLLLQQMGIDKNDIPELTQVNAGVSKGPCQVLLNVDMIHTNTLHLWTLLARRSFGVRYLYHLLQRDRPALCSNDLGPMQRPSHCGIQILKLWASGVERTSYQYDWSLPWLWPVWAKKSKSISTAACNLILNNPVKILLQSFS